MGISAAIGSVLASVGVTGAAATIGTGLIEGAGIGALSSAVTGGNIGKGALLGGLTGGLGGGLGVLAPGLPGFVDTGLGAVGAGLITGHNLKQSLTGGLEAGALSALTGGLKPKGATSTGGAATGGGTSSAAGSAAPASVAPADPNIAAPTSGGTSLPGTGGGGAGLPGDIGAGAAGPGGSLASGPTSAGEVAGIGATGGAAAGGVTGAPITVNAPAGTDFVGLGGAGAALAGTGGTANDNGNQQKNPGGGTVPGTGGKKVDFLGNLGKDPKLLLAGGGLAMNLLKGNQMPTGYSQLEQQASAAQQQSSQLEGYLASGTLPPGLQANIDTATQAAEAQIKSSYASRGMSGSSAEAQDIQAARERAQGQGAQLAMQLYQQGVSESNLSAQIYAQIMQTSQQQDQMTSQAIGNFATALAGFGGPLTAAA